MQALSTARRMDWRGWIRGVAGSFVSGAAGAIGTYAGLEAVLDVGLSQTLEIMGITALVSAIISMGKYLQTKPLPDYEQIEQAEARGFTKGVDTIAYMAKGTGTGA